MRREKCDGSQLGDLWFRFCEKPLQDCGTALRRRDGIGGLFIHPPLRYICSVYQRADGDLPRALRCSVDTSGERGNEMDARRVMTGESGLALPACLPCSGIPRSGAKIQARKRGKRSKLGKEGQIRVRGRDDGWLRLACALRLARHIPCLVLTCPATSKPRRRGPPLLPSGVIARLEEGGRPALRDREVIDPPFFSSVRRHDMTSHAMWLTGVFQP